MRVAKNHKFIEQWRAILNRNTSKQAKVLDFQRQLYNKINIINTRTTNDGYILSLNMKMNCRFLWDLCIQSMVVTHLFAFFSSEDYSITWKTVWYFKWLIGNNQLTLNLYHVNTFLNQTFWFRILYSRKEKKNTKII